MAIKRSKLGPGQLSLGEVGSAKEFGVGLSSISIEPSEDEGERVEVLSGDYDYDEGKFTGTMKGELFQDYDMSGLLAWTWEHHGEVLDFAFRPDKSANMEVKGKVKIARLVIGGDVKEHNTSDIEWQLPEVPKLTTAGG